MGNKTIGFQARACLLSLVGFESDFLREQTRYFIYEGRRALKNTRKYSFKRLIYTTDVIYNSILVF